MSIDFEADTADEGPGPPAELDGIAAELVARASGGVSLTGDGGWLTGLIDRVLEGWDCRLTLATSQAAVIVKPSAFRAAIHRHRVTVPTPTLGRPSLV